MSKADDILIEVYPSAPRRLVTLSSMVFLGGFLIYLALLRPPAEVTTQIAVIALGLLVLWVTDRVRRSTSGSIQLTREVLRHSTGEQLTTVANIQSLDRGVFAYKPSSGFLLRLAEPAPRRWEPGLWWSTGRRIGVGGVVSAPQAKAMAELITLMIAERDEAE